MREAQEQISKACFFNYTASTSAYQQINQQHEQNSNLIHHSNQQNFRSINENYSNSNSIQNSRSINENQLNHHSNRYFENQT